MIRVSDKARRLLGFLWAPDGEVLRLIPRSPEADGLGGLVGGLAFSHGRGEGDDQTFQHDGRQVLRIERSVRRSFDGSSVEVVYGNLSVVPPDPRMTTTAAYLAGRSGARNVGSTARVREGGRSA